MHGIVLISFTELTIYMYGYINYIEGEYGIDEIKQHTLSMYR